MCATAPQAALVLEDFDVVILGRGSISAPGKRIPRSELFPFSPYRSSFGHRLSLHVPGAFVFHSRDTWIVWAQFSGTLVPFLLAAPLKTVFPKKGSIFFLQCHRTTELVLRRVSGRAGAAGRSSESKHAHVSHLLKTWVDERWQGTIPTLNGCSRLNSLRGSG